MTIRNEVDTAERLTREEAATALRVSVSTIDRYLKDGTLPKAKLGKRLVRINRSDIDALLSPSTPTAPAADLSPRTSAVGASSISGDAA